MEYIDLKYKPSKDDLICEYYLEPNRISLEKACEHIASESSIGTWTELSTMKQRILQKLKPHVFYINKKSKEIKIAYPVELFEPGNMPQILSSIAGNIFGMKIVKNLRLQDISFPKKIVNSFKGPKFGIGGVRKLLKIKRRPLIGTIIKPKLGLNVKEHAKVAYDAWVGGCDFCKDDENLTSMSFNKFEKRIVQTLKLRDKAEKETGERKMYLPNVTAETSEMLKRAKFVKRNNGEYIMVDIITLGWSALQTLRNANLNLVIHAHRAGHSIITKGKHGISMLLIAEIARLIGVDQIHVGAILGKMKGTAIEVKHISEMIENRIIHPNKKAHVLEQKWYDIKPVFAVCSGGLHPGLVPKLVKIMGKNIICQFGGGIHGHELGTIAGAKAVRQALDATMKNIKLTKYAKKHKELFFAIKKWGGG